MAVFFTSDNHHRHRNIIQYSSRPWTFEDQTAELIARWNSRVGEKDDVYHLGDFVFAGAKNFNQVVEIIKSLNGRIHFIKGNHCDWKLWEMIKKEKLPNIVWIRDYAEISVNKQKIILSHYPFAIWNQSHRGSWHLHGHCHGSYQGDGKVLDVGIDNHPDHQVFSFEEVEHFMSQREFVQNSHHKGD